MKKLGDFALGLQHVGLPTNDLKATIAFYESLGFETVYQVRNEAAGEDVAFLRLKNLTIEPTKTGRQPCTGRHRHLAIDVDDVEAAYRLAQEQGYRIVSNGVEFLPFWQKGVKFFILLGPNQERVEFNQYL